jgi:hypothetical protein
MASRKTGSIGPAVLLFFLAALTVQPALARLPNGAPPGWRRQQYPTGKPPKPPANANDPASAGRPEQGRGRGMAGLPPKWVERLQEMSPEEQQRFMNNDERFRSLPAQRQAQIRQRLQQWNNLSPGERNAMRDRQRVWERMTPGQRQQIQNDLLPRWQALPPSRRQLLLGRLRVLRGMSDSQREATLHDERFLRGLNPNERHILRDLNALRNPPGR